MDLRDMSRKEKFKYLKAEGVKCKATMKTKELDSLIDQLEKFKRGETNEKPVGLKSVRGARKRVPLGTHRLKLSTDHLDIPEDKVQRWVNDDPGRIQLAQEGGYELVRKPNTAEREDGDPITTESLGDSVSAHVGTDEKGRSKRAYLMVIDKDLYEEDQEFKQRKLDALDEAILKGNVEPGEGQYVPNEGIRISVTN